MKLERLFEVKNTKLFDLSGNKIPVSESMAKKIKWSEVESDAESYNEDFPAKLRDELKSLESEKKFVFIEPEFDKNAPCEQFITAMNHTARRIKDCVSVIGFAIPVEIAEFKDNFIEELSKKHQQYCYFCKKEISNDIVLY